MAAADDDVSIREIARTLTDFRQEFRSQVAQLLRADVYRAEQQALELRIVSLEKDRDREEAERLSSRKQEDTDRQANRRQFLAVTITSIVAIVIAIIGAFR